MTEGDRQRERQQETERYKDRGQRHRETKLVGETARPRDISIGTY